jgi:DnaK suppressor protein
MEKKNLAYFQNILESWLDELLHQADDTVIGLRNSDEVLADILDQATAESEREYRLRIRSRESTLIRKIRQSLWDIENGEYGICEICGDGISIKRLKARPVARHCIKCKIALENRERLTG